MHIAAGRISLGGADRCLRCRLHPAAIVDRDRSWHETALGLCEDYPDETRSLEAARRDLAGARVLRAAFGWDAIEAERGRYDWSFWDDFVRTAKADYGLTLIPYVRYTPRWAASDDGDDFWRSRRATRATSRRSCA